MEELCQKFPHLAEGIFNSLDNQSFVNCLIASKSVVSFVEQQKFFQIRKITENIEKFHTLGETWKSIFKKANTEILSDLALAVRKSFKLRFYPNSREARYYDRRSLPSIDGLMFIESVNKFGKDATPLHVVAAYGDFRVIYSRVLTKKMLSCREWISICLLMSFLCKIFPKKIFSEWKT